jgi:glutaredoxin-like protein NrdH
MKQQSAGKARVVIYTTDHCPYCHQLKRFLVRHHIRFQERNVERSHGAAADYRKLKLRGVPVLVTGKTLISGFQPDKLKKHLL